jgi:hypothetical protein
MSNFSCERDYGDSLEKGRLLNYINSSDDDSLELV